MIIIIIIIIIDEAPLPMAAAVELRTAAIPIPAEDEFPDPWLLLNCRDTRRSPFSSSAPADDGVSLQVYKGFVKDYPVVTIEDPFDQVAPRPTAIPVLPPAFVCLQKTPVLSRRDGLDGLVSAVRPHLHPGIAAQSARTLS